MPERPYLIHDERSNAHTLGMGALYGAYRFLPARSVVAHGQDKFVSVRVGAACYEVESDDELPLRYVIADTVGRDAAQEKYLADSKLQSKIHQCEQRGG